MGYIRNKAEKGAAGLVIAAVLGFFLIWLPLFWPVLLLEGALGEGWAWTLEGLWLAALVAGTAAYILFRRNAAAERAQQQQAAYAYWWAAEQARQAELAQKRASMARTSQPWYDLGVGHYRHGTCTIKHRSAGAAGRCSSTI